MHIGSLLKQTGKDLWANDVLGLAAQCAYYCFYSLFPILLVCAAFLSLVGNRQQTFALLMDKLSHAAPANALSVIEGVVRSVVFGTGAPGLISLGLVLATWMGSNVFSSIADALNRASGVRETRPYWKTLLLSLAFVLVAGVTSAIATVAFLFGQEIVSAVANAAHLGATVRVLWLVGQDLAVVALLIALEAAVFHFLPNECLAWRESWIGAIVSTALWLIVTFGFRFYVGHFSSYNKTYGAIGAVIVLLTWMYLSMLSLLAGGQLGAELHKARSHTAPGPTGAAGAPA